jgi:hypothetical protein
MMRLPPGRFASKMIESNPGTAIAALDCFVGLASSQ